MANKISIEFAAKGHPGVIKAVKALNKEVTKLAAVNKLLNNTTEPLTKSQKEVAKGFLEQQKQVRNTSSAFSVLRSKMLLASFGASLLAGSLLKLTNMAGDADEQMSKASVVFGVSTDSILNFAKQTSEATGKSRYSLIQMAASVQDILVPMGMLRHNAADLSKEIVKTAIDVASFNNVTESDAMRDFNSALVGNHETVRKYGIVISEARMEQVALEEGIIKAGETLTDQQKILARLAIIQKDSSDAQGDAIRTATSYANVMKAVSAEFQETAIAIGKVLMPVVKAFAIIMIELFELMADPKAWLALALAVHKQAKAFIIAKMATEGYAAGVAKAKAATLAFAKALGRFLAILLVFEGIAYLIEKIFPNTEMQESEDRLARIKKQLDDISSSAQDMTMDAIVAETEKAERAMVDAIARLNELEADPMFDQLLPNPHAWKALKRNIKSTKKEIEELTEIHDAWKSELDAVTGVTEAFAKAQQKLNVSLEEQAAKLEFLQKVRSQDDISLSDGVLLDKLALDKFGMSFEELKKKSLSSAIELQKFASVQGQLKTESEVSKLQGKIDALNGVTAAQQFLNKAARDNIFINIEDAETIKALHAEYEELKRSKGVTGDLDALKERAALLKAQVEKGKELNEIEKFNVMLKFSKADLTLKEAMAYAELLRNIDEYNAKIAETQQSTGGGGKSGASQDDVDLLQAELDALRNQVTPAIEQFKADILSGMTMFGQGGLMGTFGLTDFRVTESAFGNFVNNVVANNEAIEASFAKRKDEISKMDTSTLDAQKKKLEAEIELEEDQIERIEEIEQAKNDVRANAQQMAMDAFQMFADMKRESIQNEMNAELEALKSSHQYQRASDKRKQKMEEEVKKKYAKDQLKLFRMDQAAKLASIGMNTAEGIIKAVAAFPTSIPPGSPWTYMIGAMGAAQAGMVLSQKPPKFARGGMIGGNLHTQGGTLIEAERGEYVMSRKAVDSIGQEQLNAMNRTGSAGNNINITLSGNVLSDDFVADEFIPKLEERIRVLSDGTISDRFS